MIDGTENMTELRQAEAYMTEVIRLLRRARDKHVTDRLLAQLVAEAESVRAGCEVTEERYKEKSHD